MFEKNGLDVTINTGPSGSAMVAFLINNQVQAAYGSDLAGVINHTSTTTSSPSPRAPICSLDRVVGRNIDEHGGAQGQEGRRRQGHRQRDLLAPVVEKLKLKPADYTIVNVEAPEMVAAIERGDIDAFAVWEPWPTRAMRAIPNTKILVNNETIQIIRNFVYMNKAWAEANREATARFLRALVQATQFIESNRDQAAQQVARFLRQDRGLMAELMTKVGFTMNLTADSVGNVQLAIDQLRGMGKLDKEVTPAQVIWPDALRGVAPERVKI